MPVNDIAATEAPSVLAPAGSGPLDTTQATSGLTQNGCFGIPNTNAGYSGIDRALVQALPALCRLQLPVATNPMVAQKGPQEYSATLSLSGTDTVQLAPAFANSQNVPTAPVSPATAKFVYTSRNVYVATVSPSGLVTAQNHGECVILVSAYRGVNAPISGSATPPAGQLGTEIYAELAVRVLA
jgi:hypothetical protein